MADIILKNRTGAETTYTGVNKIQVPKSGGGTQDFIIPSGAASITANGTYDVSDKASAVVNVSSSGFGTEILCATVQLYGTNFFGGGASTSWTHSIDVLIPSGSTVVCAKIGGQATVYNSNASSCLARKTVSMTDASPVSATDAGNGWTKYRYSIAYTYSSSAIFEATTSLNVWYTVDDVQLVRSSQSASITCGANGSPILAVIQSNSNTSVANSNMGFETVDISNSAVTTIPQGLFCNLTALKTLKLPALTSIGNYAFYFGTNFQSSLETIDLTKCTAVPTISSSTFNNLPANCVIRVPSTLYSQWTAAQYWSAQASQIQAVSV